MVQVSVLIPVYNRVKVTLQGLHDLTKVIRLDQNKKVTYNIVVIDDASPDSTAAIVKSNFPEVHLIEGDGNLWWTGCINKGVKYAIEVLMTDYVLLWNDDVFPASNYFEKLNSFLLETHPIKFICGSKICFDSNHEKIWSTGGYFSKWNGVKYIIRNCNLNKGIIDCNWQPGMGTLIPKFVMKQKNIWWDEKRYPQYFGDSDFTIRCQEKGVEIKTNLELVLYNRTELSGDRVNPSFRMIWSSLFSIRSVYELKRNLMFYSQHGVVPFVYYGMFKKYAYYFWKTLKSTING